MLLTHLDNIYINDHILPKTLWNSINVLKIRTKSNISTVFLIVLIICLNKWLISAFFEITAKKIKENV